MAIDHKVGRWVVSLRDISWEGLGCEKRVVGVVGGGWWILGSLVPQLWWGIQ